MPCRTDGPLGSVSIAFAVFGYRSNHWLVIPSAAGALSGGFVVYRMR
jgi:hypothetical protein